MKFCNKCGAEIDDMGKFCPSCGAAVEIEQERIQDRGELLYESKGAPIIRVGALAVCVIILVVAAVYFWVLSGSKTKQVPIGSISGGRYVEEGYIGGGYVFTEEGRRNLQILGCVAMISAGVFFDILIGMKRCWTKIYSNHIEAQAVSYGFNKNIARIFYHQINAVQIQGFTIRIVAGGQKIRLICRDTNQAFELINQRISH